MVKYLVKLLIILSDLHCGHRCGVTPPGWQYPMHDVDPTRRRFAESQRFCWNWLVDKASELKVYKTALAQGHPIETLLMINGDGPEGNGKFNGGIECVTVDRLDQIEMVLQTARLFEPNWNKTYINVGTPSHTGEQEEYERFLAQRLDDCYGPVDSGERFMERRNLAINFGQCISGVWTHRRVENFRHFVGNSSVPYGRQTMLSKEQIMNLLMAEAGMEDKADGIWRSHVHNYTVAMNYINGEKTAISTPALQTPGTKYGKRQLSTIVNYGFLTVLYFSDGSFQVQPFIVNIPMARTITTEA